MNPPSAAAAARLLPAPVAHADTIRRGHINTTLRVELEDGSAWALQQLNPALADERLVMANLEAIIAQLRRCRHSTLELATDDDGTPWVVIDGRYWRAYRWLGATTAAEHSSPDWAGLASLIGRFSAALATVDDSQIVTIIDRFHDPVRYWDGLDRAVVADRVGRLHGSRVELARLRDLAARIWDETPAARWGELPRQIVHNDTKSANLIVDHQGSPVALIDLDTTMMGTPMSDLGEFLRGYRPRDHDGPGTTQLVAMVRAFVDALGRPLTAPEWEALPTVGAVMSFENSVRALIDHLDGDRYYDLGSGANLERHRRHEARAEEQLDQGPALAAALAVDDEQRRASL